MQLLSFTKLIRKDASHAPTLALILTVAVSVAALALALPTNSGHAQVDEPAYGGQAYQLAQSNELGNSDPGGGGGGTSGDGSNDTASGSQHHCKAYDSNGDDDTDEKVCIENLSADPPRFGPGESTDISWDIKRYLAAAPESVVRCNLGGPEIEPLPGPEESTTTLAYSDFSAPTNVTVVCEVAADDDGLVPDPEAYDDFRQWVSVFLDSGDDNTAPEAIKDGDNQIAICAKDSLDINVVHNDSDSAIYDPQTEVTTYLDQDGDELEVSEIVSQPENEAGTATTIPGNRNEVNFEPQAGFTGTVNFEYKLSDGQDQTDDAVATVAVDVQGPNGGCGNIEVSFDAADVDVSNLEGAEATPAYDHPNIDNPGSRLGSQELTPERAEQAAASGQNEGQNPALSWNVPLEKATNTAEMLRGNITPPDGYDFKTVDTIDKDTELFEQFGESPETDRTGENTSAYLGKDYEPETPDPTVTCYNDQDGDGYGNPGTATERSSCQTDEALNSNDCYDQNEDANPDQDSFFAEARGDGSFDYDCDGGIDKEYTKTYSRGSCVRRDTGSGYDCEFEDTDNVSTGWQNSVPNCGNSGTYHTTASCSGQCPGSSEVPPCDSGRRVCTTNTNTVSRTQKCR